MYVWVCFCFLVGTIEPNQSSIEPEVNYLERNNVTIITHLSYGTYNVNDILKMRTKIFGLFAEFQFQQVVGGEDYMCIFGST